MTRSLVHPATPGLRIASLGLAVALATAACAPEAADDAGAEAETREAVAGAEAVEGEAGAEAMGTAEDSAAMLARRVMDAMGGEAAWDSVRFLAFDWIVERGDTDFRRSHAWDRWEGTYRVEVESEGERHVAIFDVGEVRRDSAFGKVPAGDVWADGEKLEGAAADSALSRFYGIFINDSYWLLMPYKWRDPGVHLEYVGRDTLPDGTVAPGVHLTFEEDLGVTNDEYWAWLDPETGRMTAWQYHLQGRDEPGDVIRWEDWQPVGPIWLATDRVWPDGSVNIRFENLRASREVPEDAFAPPPARAAGEDTTGEGDS